MAETIQIDGIVHVERDSQFDDSKYRSGGIRLGYVELSGATSDLKQGVLLEAGFDDIEPNEPRTISSWAYGYAAEKVRVIDNRARNMPCYSPGHTFVEKLQTIFVKFRKQQETGSFPINFLRQFYDVYCLLEVPEVLSFMGTDGYYAHKSKRFRSEKPNIAENEAFRLSSTETKRAYEAAYDSTKSLYYRDRPSFSEILQRINIYASRL